MPSKKVHKYFERLILGKEYDVGRIIDKPAKYLGKKHRILFHDTETALILGLLKRDINYSIATLLHIALDKSIKGKTAKLLERFLK